MEPKGLLKMEAVLCLRDGKSIQPDVVVLELEHRQ